MKKIGFKKEFNKKFFPGFLVGAALLGMVSCHPKVKVKAAVHPPKLNSQQALQAAIKKGEHLVAVSGCEDCHTPWKIGPKGIPMPDMSRQLSGSPAAAEPPKFKIPPGYMVENILTHASTGPWGTSFPANLTPDKKTGIGNWSFQEFANVIRTGKYQAEWSGKGTGRPLMPPMPWQDYAQYSTQDLHDIYDYLMSLKPVSNKVPPYVPPHH